MQGVVAGMQDGLICACALRSWIDATIAGAAYAEAFKKYRRARSTSEGSSRERVTAGR